MADGSCHFSFNISETKHITKKFTMDITITLKNFINSPKRKYIARSLYKWNLHNVLKSL